MPPFAAESRIEEVLDDEARRLFKEWKRRFDDIPKGWKERTEYSSRPPGYPQPAWGELRTAADDVCDRLGGLVRQ